MNPLSMGFRRNHPGRLKKKAEIRVRTKPALRRGRNSKMFSSVLALAARIDLATPSPHTTDPEEIFQEDLLGSSQVN